MAVHRAWQRPILAPEEAAIREMHARGVGVLEIARRLGRPKGTISRLLRQPSATRRRRVDFTATPPRSES